MAMWDVSDYEGINNDSLKDCYKFYLKAIENLAIFYAISEETAINYATGKGTGKKFFLSNNFPECATTIITDNEAIKLINNNTYLNYLREDFIIRICLIFEDFINKLLDILKLDKKEATSFNSYSNIYNLEYKSDSVVFRKIYFIINQLSLNAIIYKINSNTLQMLDQVVVIRNVLIHFNGKVAKENHDKIIRDSFKDEKKNIIIPDNSIDDFIHRFTININPLVYDIDKYMTEERSIVI